MMAEMSTRGGAMARAAQAERELEDVRALVADIRACRTCAGKMEPEPRPVVRLHPGARILVIGQAPGVRVHAVGAPFVDPSGERLRDWMGIDEGVFYDPARVAVAPAGFCFPGLTPGGADRPPRRECAPQWQHRVHDALPGIVLTLLVGGYGHKIGLGERAAGGVTETVRRFAEFAPRVIPLPHPSWRNSAWLKKHRWFETDLLPVLRAAVADALR
ncbi:MAG: uracil-DNA glycosylase family protein [Maricaulaceae bacterium]|jgi:uracil-DNA glycosylase